MARPRNTDERRRQIAEALKMVMAKQGYDGTSIAEIAATANLRKGLVHYHFEKKLDILLEVLELLDESHYQNLERALASCYGPAQELEAFVRFHLALEQADRETLACWLTLSGEALRQVRVRGPFAGALSRTVERLRKIIRRGVTAGELRCARPQVAASALVAAIQGYFVLAATAPGVIPRGSAAGAVLEMATGLLSPSRPFSSRP
jgi:TetR/AcrR family transcriptional repressor of bet genes